jgi:hypothetical protein
MANYDVTFYAPIDGGGSNLTSTKKTISAPDLSCLFRQVNTLLSGDHRKAMVLGIQDGENNILFTSKLLAIEGIDGRVLQISMPQPV